jgi:hypothetical protein
MQAIFSAIIPGPNDPAPLDLRAAAGWSPPKRFGAKVEAADPE